MRADVQLAAVFQRLIYDARERPECMKCRKPATIASVQDDPSKIRVTLLCHDAVECVELPIDDRGFLIDPETAVRRFVAQWPKRAFLQRVASYKTTTRPERRVVR